MTVTIKLTAPIQQRPQPGAFSRDGLPTAELSAEGKTYDQALSRLWAQLPEGWQVLFIMRS